ncbi:translation elongation factor Ts [Candidatus Chlamydia sanziniae]|uniref:Elongation factor Ts n=1 Tax=Candidatus Chlamydia sanziniae TaxID=1806891 RepID=A0A1A9HWN1_9CHLA|nr:translation elongation factor Ts [Candidatus Chlamydia sanziniae]ANH78503.1 Translation elongation factor Ts [Candidatus Chlamydia sanziniae]
MGDFSIETLKQLRQHTGVGLTKCKEALEACEGNLEKATIYLRKLGLASANKKDHRETKEGLIAAKSDAHGSALVEVNVETDFVANNNVFRDFVTVLLNDILDHKTDSVAALSQLPSSKDPSLTVDELRAVTMQTVGENIRIRRVAYFPKSSHESVGIYSHGNGKTVSLVILKGSSKGESLAKDIAMHVVASQPQFLSKGSVPAEAIDKEKEVASSQTQGKSQEVIDKIIQGKLGAFFQETCLLEQPFIKNSTLSIQNLIDDFSKILGEFVEVEKFILWKIGA